MELIGEWTAFHDHMPGKPKTLTASGQAQFRTEGWSVAVRRSEPQGINPKMLLLELEATHDGGSPEALTTIDVTWTEETDFEYEQVAFTVLGSPEGDAVEGKTIDVKCVH
ncbi:hypothetical protein [Mycolicibacterium baixiangningiae]|uniref:hypothetical protein n=1 Tax=Mycolicibacterium baixiangningiae TaxID=2761578 RepID=UPI00186659EF|nr:hypothetical protein [Mycolicibacterium baixiangningiae]